MSRKIIPYNPKLKHLAKALKKNMTLSEVLLWQELKGKQVMGYDLNRQKPIDSFIRLLIKIKCINSIIFLLFSGQSRIGH